MRTFLTTEIKHLQVSDYGNGQSSCFVLHQGFAIYCPSGQLAKLHQIQWWTSQTTYRRQVQGEQLAAIDSLSKVRKTEICGSLSFPQHCPQRISGRKISFGFCSLGQNPFFFPLQFVILLPPGWFSKSTLTCLHTHCSLCVVIPLSDNSASWHSAQFRRWKQFNAYCKCWWNWVILEQH